MNTRLRIPVLVTVLALVCTTSFLARSACAQGCGGRFFGGRVHFPMRASWQSWPGHIGHRPAPTYDEYYHYMNSHNPKYYGGFHTSYLQNTGWPPGDIGFRGNGVFQTAW